MSWGCELRLLLCVVLATASCSADAASGVQSLALAEYAKYHRQITGREPAAGSVRCVIDRSVSRGGHDAYAIKSDAQGVVLTGSNARSVLYAVYDLLERRG